jgi:tRNA nucleotidyltransferase (CCA-adding enzyme)
MNFDIIPREALNMAGLLESRGFEAFFVGGCVRDILRGTRPNDWDIATNATPEQMKECFAGLRVIETGIKHGTLTVISDGLSFEVTTYRVDGKYEDNRRPTEVYFTRNLADDLSRRDFTINAMAYSPGRGLVDIFGGREDIEKKIIRCVGNPNRRFHEDGLRILRALRFASALDFWVEEDTASSIHENRSLLKNISAERVRDEFFKLIVGPGAERVLLEFFDVICEFIPEIKPAADFEQKHAYYLYARSVRTMAAEDKGDKYVRLALFFHGIGKPDDFGEDKEGRQEYEEQNAELAGTILRRLRSDNRTISTVKCLIRARHTATPKAEGEMRRLLAFFGEQNLRRLLGLRRAEISAQMPGQRPPGLEEIEAAETLLSEVLKKECCLSLRDLAVGGEDLIALGMRPGRGIGKLLTGLLDEVIDGRLPNEREALLRAAAKIIERKK